VRRANQSAAQPQTSANLFGEANDDQGTNEVARQFQGRLSTKNVQFALVPFAQDPDAGINSRGATWRIWAAWARL
jgi:hypothetical protein